MMQEDTTDQTQISSHSCFHYIYSASFRSYFSVFIRVI